MERDPHLQGRDDLGRHIVLEVENVVECAIVLVCPHVASGLGLDQPAQSPECDRRPANAALEHISHPKLSGDLAHVDRFALMGERRVASNDEEFVDVRQLRDEILGYAIGEELLLRSPPILTKGITAIEGLSGIGRAGDDWRLGGPTEMRKARRGRVCFSDGAHPCPRRAGRACR